MKFSDKPFQETIHIYPSWDGEAIALAVRATHDEPVIVEMTYDETNELIKLLQDCIPRAKAKVDRRKQQGEDE